MPECHLSREPFFFKNGDLAQNTYIHVCQGTLPFAAPCRMSAGSKNTRRPHQVFFIYVKQWCHYLGEQIENSNLNFQTWHSDLLCFNQNPCRFHPNQLDDNIFIIQPTRLNMSHFKQYITQLIRLLLPLLSRDENLIKLIYDKFPQQKSSFHFPQWRYAG
jgi:hypothetical protein